MRKGRILGTSGCIVILAAMMTLTGCGEPKKARALVREAQRVHGPCEVVSQSETEDGVRVVLRDELQGFEYTVSSGMNSIDIDGANFGSVPGSSDGFSSALMEYVIGETEFDIDRICSEYGLTRDENGGINYFYFGEDVDESRAIEGLEAIAEVLQEYNLKNRLDGVIINLSHDENWLQERLDEMVYENGEDAYSDYAFSAAGRSELSHVGSVELPGTDFRDG